MTDPSDNVTMEMPGVDAVWLVLLRQAVRDAGKRGCSGVAEKLGRSRGYVSQAINGLDKQPRSQDFINRVMDAYGRIDCPHLVIDIAPSECVAFHSRSYGAIESEDVPHWRACQNCRHNKPTTTTPALEVSKS